MLFLFFSGVGEKIMFRTTQICNSKKKTDYENENQANREEIDDFFPIFSTQRQENLSLVKRISPSDAECCELTRVNFVIGYVFQAKNDFSTILKKAKSAQNDEL